MPEKHSRVFYHMGIHYCLSPEYKKTPQITPLDLFVVVQTSDPLDIYRGVSFPLRYINNQPARRRARKNKP